MAEIPESVVLLLEAPDGYIMQQRPNLPGKLAYPGKLQFFGGHVEADDEDALAAIRREVDEELKGEDVRELSFQKIWEGPFHGEDTHGNPIDRFVTLFGARTDTLVQSKEQGEVVKIPKNPAAIEAHKDNLTPFAYQALKKVINGGFEWR